MNSNTNKGFKVEEYLPIDFRIKNDFFYENAYLIMQSSQQEKKNSHLDVLENFKTKANIISSKKTIRKHSPIKHISSSKYKANKDNRLKIKLPSLSDFRETLGLYLTLETPQVKKKQSILNIASRNKIIDSKERDSYMNIRDSGSSFRDNIETVNSESFKPKAIEMEEVGAKSESRSKSKLRGNHTKNSSKFSNYFSKIPKKLLSNDSKKGCESPNKNSTTCFSFNKLNPELDNQAILNDLNKIKLSIICKQHKKSENLINQSENCRKIFQSVQDGKFKYDEGKKTYVMNTEYLYEENAEKNEFMNSLETLDSLKKSLPDFKTKIKNLKKSKALIEKRKLEANYNSEEINYKLDELLSENEKKLAWNKLDSKKMVNQTLKHIRLIERYPGRVKFSANKMIIRRPIEDNDKFNSKSRKFHKSLEIIKPKFKNIGKCKLMIVPKEIKEPYNEHESIFNLNLKLNKQIGEIMSPHLLINKEKLFFENISSPKQINGSVFKYNSEACEKIFNICDNVENNNLKIMDDVKKLRDFYKKNNMFLDPKSAYEVPINFVRKTKYKC